MTTPTDPMQGNEIIAEFMKLYSAKRYYEGGKMQYHTSWDWLMPVVEKIKKIAMAKNVPYCSDVELGGAICKITGLSIVCSIEQVYYAVLQFITWYNSTHNGTTNE